MSSSQVICHHSPWGGVLRSFHTFEPEANSQGKHIAFQMIFGFERLAMSQTCLVRRAFEENMYNIDDRQPTGRRHREAAPRQIRHLEQPHLRVTAVSPGGRGDCCVLKPFFP
jgi:hypothetical protein